MRCTWLLMFMVGLLVEWTDTRQGISTWGGSGLEAPGGGPVDGAQQERILVSARFWGTTCTWESCNGGWTCQIPPEGCGARRTRVCLCV